MTKSTRSQANETNFSNKVKKEQQDFARKSKNTIIPTCICCGDVTHYRNDMWECDNCDENYGTDYCKCKGSSAGIGAAC